MFQRWKRLLFLFGCIAAFGVGAYWYLQPPRMEGIVAFIVYEDGQEVVYISQGDISRATAVQNIPANIPTKKISPNGEWLLLQGFSDLSLIRIDGTGYRPIASSVSPKCTADWSPDGRRVIFCSDRTGNNEIYTIQIDGSNEQQLTQDGGDIRLAKWSPDGLHIAYQMGRNIYVMQTDGSHAYSGRVNVDSIYQFSWSPDGEHLAMASEHGLYVVRYDGTGLQQLASSKFRIGSPKWSPDNQYIGFLNNSELHVIRPNGTELRQLGRYADDNFLWSPDSQWILFTVSTKGTICPCIVNIRGGLPRIVSMRPNLIHLLSWTS